MSLSDIAEAGAQTTDQTTTDDTKTDSGESEKSTLESLGELLAQDEPSPGGDQDASSGSDTTKPTQFNDLAGAIDMKLDDLYQLEIKLSEDGEPVTIEQLKDGHAKVTQLDFDRAEWEERKTEQEQELMRAQTELREIMQALPENAIKPEVLEKIRAKADATTKLERAKTLEAIPEWSDAKARESDIEGMTEYLTGYGFPIGYLANVIDHRQLKFFRDAWRQNQRIKTALAAVRTGKPVKGGTNKPQKKAPAKNALSSITPKRGESRLKTALLNQ